MRMITRPKRRFLAQPVPPLYVSFLVVRVRKLVEAQLIMPM